MRVALQNFMRRNLGIGWNDACAGVIWAISVKVCNGQRYKSFVADSILTLNEARRGAIVTHGWGYHYLRTVAEARTEGDLAGGIANDLGLECYGCDAEQEWAGCWGAPHTPDPTGAAQAFADAFYRRAPYTGLAWNGLARIADKAVSQYTVYAPQCYGTITKIGGAMDRRAAPRCGLITAPVVDGGPKARIPDAISFGNRNSVAWLSFWLGNGASGRAKAIAAEIHKRGY